MSQRRNWVSWEFVLFLLVAIAYTYPFWKTHWDMQLVATHLDQKFIDYRCPQDKEVMLWLQQPIKLEVVNLLGGQLCARLNRVKDLFLAKTKAIAPAKKRLNALEIVILRSRDDFEYYASELGYSAGLLGQYIEVDLALTDLSARAFLYMHGDLELLDRRVLIEEASVSLVSSTFEHEYVHYLDSRFNIHTPFSGYRLETRMLWWAEGLAEYFAEGEHNVDALPVVIEAAGLGKSAIPSLKTIFRAQYQDVFKPGYEHLAYKWSYIVHRFLLEAGYRHHWLALLEALRQSDHDQAIVDYHSRLDKLEELLNQPFKHWIMEHFGASDPLSAP